MLYEKLTRKIVKEPIVCLTIILFVWGCEKETVKTPPIPQIHFKQTGYVISDTSTATVAIEIEGSTYVGAYAFPVYFQMEGTAQPGVDFTTQHTVFTNADGDLFFKTNMAQGSRKSAIVIKPLNNAGGNKTLTIRLFPDQERDRYTLASSTLTATLEISDN